MKWVVVLACASLFGEAAARPSTRSTPSPDAAKEFEAKRLFTEGRKLVDSGRADDACALFEESYELDPAPGTALNLGECEERAEHWGEAVALYASAATTFEETQDAVRARFARERAAQVLAAHPGAGEPVAPPHAAPVEEARASSSSSSSSSSSASRTAIKVVTVGSFALAVMAGGFAVYSFGQIQDYNDGEPAIGFDGSALGGDDCGSPTISLGSARSRWNAACTAASRLRFLFPLTVVSTAVGVGTLIYLVVSKPKRGTLAVVPTVSPGTVAVTALVEW